MMMGSKQGQVAAGAMMLFAAAALGGTALASPGSGVTATTYATATLNESVQGNLDKVKFQTKEPTLVRTQKLEFARGSYTGFHHHPGVVIVTVASGSVDLVDSSCATETKSAGTVWVEDDEHVHQAVSKNGAVIYATYVVPKEGNSFRVEEQVPFCATRL
jgi:quercetin dioxygenase-like cupin family protein